MIDTKIFAAGAVSILIEVSKWKGDKKTPAKFKCTIRDERHSPSAFVAERDTALAAERECCEAYLAHYADKKLRLHPATMKARPSDEPEIEPEVQREEKAKPPSTKPKVEATKPPPATVKAVSPVRPLTIQKSGQIPLPAAKKQAKREDDDFEY